jgi:quercetin 2,3-dioxygenase
MPTTAMLTLHPLGFPWPTQDPFLFCVHHDDRYPQGNGRYGPAASLSGRQVGSDFSCCDGWSMYHGRQVPGFPAHPHRGFETVTLVRTGRIDHADSMGAAARYGDGDVQWLTAGRGIQHSEMFPLLSTTTPNPLDLFQIWLNLPARQKFAAPHFTMLWAGDVNSAATPAELLMLQGRPIGEPVAQYGPFVMNTEAEIRQAFADYQRTQFGGWQWPDTTPVHGSDPTRFARHADGRTEHPPTR